MKNYDLLVVSVEPFPYGKAATNRMISYLVGLAEEKSVLYLCLSGPRYNNSQELDRKGTYNGIEFEYMGSPIVPSYPNIVQRTLNLILRYLKLYYLLIFKIKTKSILLYSSDHRLTNIIYLISRIRGFNTFRDVTELVGHNYLRDNRALSQMKKQALRLSGLLTISKGIYDFFDNLPDNKKFLLPVLVDISRFSVSDDKEKYFFYCSGANLERDGLLDTLKGFLLFADRNPGYTLQIASMINIDNAYHLECKKMIDAHSDCIHYLGALPSYEIPIKMSRATALFLTPHHNYETKGFPTKLGEYLASATPTICSSIDDLMDVIDDNIAYIVKPNSPNLIAEAIEKIVCNEQQAKEVGLSGRNFMIRNYTINSYKDKLIDFLKLN